MQHNLVYKMISLVLLASMALAACASTASQGTAPTDVPTVEPTAVPTEVPTPEPMVFTDGLGHSVSLAAPAQRVISFAPSNTEILFAVGAGSQVVGRDEFSNYPAEAADLPIIGGSWGGYNAEAIVGLNPDLILAAEINTPDQVKEMEDLGLNVYYLSNPKDFEGLYQVLELVAMMTGHEQETGALIESLKARVSTVESKMASITDTPTVFYELDSTDPNAPYTTGPGTFVDLVINKAGGINMAGAFDISWVQISLEELVVQDPAYIVLGDSNYGVTPENVQTRAGWENIAAVKNGKVFPFNDDLVSRPGPRLVDGLEEMAKLLHPDLFK
jgi:iron complex transport system substrate-binding protein